MNKTSHRAGAVQFMAGNIANLTDSVAPAAGTVISGIVQTGPGIKAGLTLQPLTAINPNLFEFSFHDLVTGPVSGQIPKVFVDFVRLADVDKRASLASFVTVAEGQIRAKTATDHILLHHVVSGPQVRALILDPTGIEKKLGVEMLIRPANLTRLRSELDTLIQGHFTLAPSLDNFRDLGDLANVLVDCGINVLGIESKVLHTNLANRAARHNKAIRADQSRHTDKGRNGGSTIRAIHNAKLRAHNGRVKVIRAVIDNLQARISKRHGIIKGSETNLVARVGRVSFTGIGDTDARDSHITFRHLLDNASRGNEGVAVGAVRIGAFREQARVLRGRGGEKFSCDH